MSFSRVPLVVFLISLMSFPGSTGLAAGDLRAERYLAREAVLDWDPVPVSLVGQTVQRAADPDSQFETVATLSGDALWYKDTNGGEGLDPGTTYYYRISRDLGGTTTYSDQAAVEIPAEIPHDGWRVLPIRFQSEYDAGMPGGEAEQHLHSMDRCLTHPNVIYINQDVAGIWRSVDWGKTWQKSLDVGLYLNSGQSMAVDPLDPNLLLIEVDNTFNYKATAAEGIYRSEDGGNSWTRVLATATNYNSSQGRSFRKAIACDLTSLAGGRAQRWYVGIPNNGLYRSEDGGESFPSTYESSLAGHEVIFQVCPDPLDGQTVWVGSDQGLFVSLERGANLEPVGNLPSGRVTSVAVDPRNTSRIYAVVENNGLYRSTNGGSSFTLLKYFPARRVFMNPTHPDTLFLIGSTYTITTHDGGQTWIENAVSIAHPEVGDIRSGTAMEIDGSLAALAPNPLDPNEAVGYAKASLWKTTDGGRTYLDSSNLFTGYAWSWWNHGASFDPFDPDRWAFFNNDVGMTLTTTGGDWFVNRNPQAWSWYQSGLIQWIGTNAGAIQPVPGSQRIVASVGDYFRAQLMRTSNLGQSWTLLTDAASVDQDLDMNLFIAFHPQDTDFVYAGDKVSTDGGMTFAHVNFGSYATDDPYLAGMCGAQPDTVYAVSKDRYKILRSDDRGNTWSNYSTPGWRVGPFDSLPTFAAHPADPDVIFSIDAGGDLARFDGTSWTSLGVLNARDASDPTTPAYTYVRTVTVDPNNPDILYAGLMGSGIESAWRSLDGGASWHSIQENLPRNGLSAMAVNPHTGELFVGTLMGTWIYPAPYELGEPVYAKAHSRQPGVPEPVGGYQAWRLEQFGIIDFMDEAISGRESDPDGDRRSNFQEYAFGFDPLTADPQPLWESSVTREGGMLQVTLRYRSRGSDALLDYRILASGDLRSWNELAGESLESTLESTDASGIETWNLRVQLDPAADLPAFLKLSVMEVNQ